MRRPDRPLISVVLSFRNEADNIPTLVARLDRMFATQTVEYELLFVNDASTDASLSLLVAERERNPRVKVVNLSRRFGVAEGVLAGMATSSGDAVVYMDADLQDPSRGDSQRSSIAGATGRMSSTPSGRSATAKTR